MGNKLVTTLTHPCGATIKIFAEHGHHWADDSRDPASEPMQWLGAGKRGARDHVALMMRMGFTKAVGS